MKHLVKEQLENGLNHIKNSPENEGLLELIVCRPEVNKRKELSEGLLDLEVGLVGDNWKTRGSSRTNDGLGHPQMQLNIMNSRAIALMAQEKSRWKLAGDQLYVDFDLSSENLPIGTKLSIGNAVVQITEIPHLGCKKFVERFGLDAMKFVNSKVGKSLNLRGVNAKVVRPGEIIIGDKIKKLL